LGVSDHGATSTPLLAFAPQPITYRLKQGKPLVYSLGPDGVDNGGSPIKGAVDQNSKGDLLQGGTR